MGFWSWAWVIRQSWAVGRACTPWNWRSRKPSCASWQPFWKATVRSYDPSLRPPLRKPQMLAHFLICKVFKIMTLWPHVTKTLEPSTHVQSVEPDIQVKVTEETELNSSAVLSPCSLLKLFSRKHTIQVHCWHHPEPGFFSLKEMYLNVDSHESVYW